MMIELLTDKEKHLLMMLHAVDEPIRFNGYDDQQLCKVLREKGLAEWMTWESANPYYFLTEKGRFKAERLFRQGDVEW